MMCLWILTSKRENTLIFVTRSLVWFSGCNHLVIAKIGCSKADCSRALTLAKISSCLSLSSLSNWSLNCLVPQVSSISMRFLAVFPVQVLFGVTCVFLSLSFNHESLCLGSFFLWCSFCDCSSFSGVIVLQFCICFYLPFRFYLVS